MRAPPGGAVGDAGRQADLTGGERSAPQKCSVAATLVTLQACSIAWSMRRCVRWGGGAGPKWPAPESAVGAVSPRLALGVAEGRPLDGDRVAAMAQPAEEGVDHGLVSEDVVPLLVLQVRGDDGGLLVVALFHQLEEDVRLLGSAVEVAELVDVEDVQASEPIDELRPR